MPTKVPRSVSQGGFINFHHLNSISLVTSRGFDSSPTVRLLSQSYLLLSCGYQRNSSNEHVLYGSLNFVPQNPVHITYPIFPISINATTDHQYT